MPRSRLPLIDEHRRAIAAEPESVWRALVAELDCTRRSALRRAFAAALRCDHRRASDARPDEVGATIPGFAVSRAEPPAALTLAGRHRFAAYALEFELVRSAPGATTLQARTLAAFPGRSGALYRRLVIGSRVHVVAVTSLLRAVARRT